jgi:hypothetical protein
MGSKPPRNSANAGRNLRLNYWIMIWYQFGAHRDARCRRNPNSLRCDATKGIRTWLIPFSFLEWLKRAKTRATPPPRGRETSQNVGALLVIWVAKAVCCCTGNRSGRLREPCSTRVNLDGGIGGLPREKLDAPGAPEQLQRRSGAVEGAAPGGTALPPEAAGATAGGQSVQIPPQLASSERWRN